MYPPPAIRLLFKQLDIKGLIKTVYWNFYLFPSKIAIRFPLAMNGYTKFHCKRGSIEFAFSNPNSASITFGLSHQSCSCEKNSLIQIEGKMIVGEGYHRFAAGLVLKIRKIGILQLGDNISIGPSCKFFINKSSFIGNDCLISWNCQFMDNDSHPIFDPGNNQINISKGFEILDHVWVGSNTSVLKGVNVATGVIIPTGSVVTKSIKNSNTVSSNSKILKHNVSWKNEPLED